MSRRSEPSAVPRNVSKTGPALARSAAAGLAALYDRAVDAVLIRPHEIGTAAEAIAFSQTDTAWNADALTDQVRKVAVTLLPMLKRAGVLSRTPGLRRVPSVAVASTVGAVSTQLWSGVSDLQILSALIATRLRRAGYDADPPLVKRLAIELYTYPDRPPRLDTVPASATAVLAKWMIAGAIGRTTSKQAHRAFVAAERLDVGALMKRWPDLRR